LSAVCWVSLGEPLHIFTISLEQVRAYQEGTDIGEVLVDTGQLSYPVLMDGEVVSSITVGKQDDQWKFVSLGNPNLTKAWPRHARAEQRGVDRKDPTEYSVSIPALYAIFVAHRDDAGRVRFTHVLEEEPRPGVVPTPLSRTRPSRARTSSGGFRPSCRPLAPEPLHDLGAFPSNTASG
jgi:hypothetical protein